MLEDVEVSRSFIKRIKSTGEMTEPWGTPALMECRLERKPSTLMAINLSHVVSTIAGIPSGFLDSEVLSWRSVCPIVKVSCVVESFFPDTSKFICTIHRSPDLNIHELLLDHLSK